MRRRSAWLGAVTTAALAIGFAGWFPYYRLEREVAAARAEGLWTELTDIPRGIAAANPSGENAQVIVGITVDEMRKHGLRRPGIREATDHLLKGTASSAEDRLVRQTIEENSELLASWRKGADCRRLDFGRDWKQGYAVLFPELSEINFASKLLVAAAALGVQSKENLIAAAHLSALIRQEPNVIAGMVSVAIGRTALNEAKREDLGTIVDEALGPPLDVRWAYASEFPFALDTMRRVGTPAWFKSLGTTDNRSILERIRNTGPWRANAAYRLVRDYRALWKDMPKDGKDYVAAGQAIDHWAPKVNDQLFEVSSIMGKLIGGGPASMSQFVKSFENFEAERQAVRKR